MQFSHKEGKNVRQSCTKLGDGVCWAPKVRYMFIILLILSKNVIQKYIHILLENCLKKD